MSAEEIRNLPGNGRNFQSLINIVPGVLTDQLPNAGGQAVAGGTPYVIDGIVLTDPLPPTTDPTSLNLEAIEDIEVQRGDFEAEYGRASGGVINIVTKSGTNEFRSGMGGLFDITLNEGAGGTCVSGIGGLPGGGTAKGTLKFDVPLEIPRNFFRGQPLGPGGSIYVPPCDGTQGPTLFFKGNFPKPGTPTHVMLTPQSGYNVDLKPLINLGFDFDRDRIGESFAVGSGSSFGMDWSKDFKLSVFSGTKSYWNWGKYDRFQFSERFQLSDPESPGSSDHVFINYNYYNNTPSACPNVPGKVFGFERTFLGGVSTDFTVPFKPYAPDAATCEEIGRTINQLGAAGGPKDTYQATLGGYIVRDKLWFFTAGRQGADEQQANEPVAEDELLGVEHALRPEFVVGLNLTYRMLTDALDNVPAVNSFGLLPGVQGGGLELRRTASTGRLELEPAPGGGERGAHESEPMIYIEALGGPTGEVYEVTIVGDAAGDLNGYSAIEPVDVSSREREEIVEDLRDAEGPRRTFKANGYCLDYAMRAPPAGAIFRLAGSAAQEAFRPLAQVLEAARQLHEQGRLNVDANPESYLHSIRQWALWTVTESFDREKFITAFSKQVRENLEGQGQAWTDPVAAAVRRHAESRWGDIQNVLELAERP